MTSKPRPGSNAAAKPELYDVTHHASLRVLPLGADVAMTSSAAEGPRLHLVDTFLRRLRSPSRRRSKALYLARERDGRNIVLRVRYLGHDQLGLASRWCRASRATRCGWRLRLGRSTCALRCRTACRRRRRPSRRNPYRCVVRVIALDAAVTVSVSVDGERVAVSASGITGASGQVAPYIGPHGHLALPRLLHASMGSGARHGVRLRERALQRATAPSSGPGRPCATNTVVQCLAESSTAAATRCASASVKAASMSTAPPHRSPASKPRKKPCGEPTMGVTLSGSGEDRNGEQQRGEEWFMVREKKRTGPW